MIYYQVDTLHWGKLKFVLVAGIHRGSLLTAAMNGIPPQLSEQILGESSVKLLSYNRASRGRQEIQSMGSNDQRSFTEHCVCAELICGDMTAVRFYDL